jgi:hypothetical protein
MPMYRTRPLACIALFAVLACACRGQAPDQRAATTAAAAKGTAGLVGPLATDTSAEIVSWVDGQVVTDWAI